MRRKTTRWWWVYCDRQPQHEGGITGVARGRKRRFRMRKEVVVLVEVFKDREQGSARVLHYTRRENHTTKGTNLWTVPAKEGSQREIKKETSNKTSGFSAKWTYMQFVSTNAVFEFIKYCGDQEINIYLIYLFKHSLNTCSYRSWTVPVLWQAAESSHCYGVGAVYEQMQLVWKAGACVAKNGYQWALCILTATSPASLASSLLQRSLPN